MPVPKVSSGATTESRAVHRVRIIGGNVHHRGIGRHDRDVIASALRRDDASTCASCGWRRARPDPLHRLLGVRLERARVLRLGAQLLDRRRDILRLVHDRVAKVGRPGKILAHLFDEVWKTRHRFDRGIPFLAVDAGKVVFRDKRLIFLKPALRLNDFERIGGRGQHLGEQGVGIERDRREQLAQFLAAEMVGFRRWLLRLRRRRRGAPPGGASVVAAAPRRGLGGAGLGAAGAVPPASWASASSGPRARATAKATARQPWVRRRRRFIASSMISSQWLLRGAATPMFTG